jgi:hypothetical protein
MAKQNNTHPIIGNKAPKLKPAIKSQPANNGNVPPAKKVKKVPKVNGIKKKKQSPVNQLAEMLINHHTELTTCSDEETKACLQRQFAADVKKFSAANHKLADDNLKVMLLLKDLGIPLYPQLGSPLIDSDLQIRVPTYGYNGGTLTLMSTKKMTEVGFL